ncbi:VCBS repeat protein [Flagellimonas meridianipacifica]|uniref:VCBS repeat protein n=2 Tax=Flagellimonas meridianipacifica TaxID=1080225 RepID=A0A2T0MFZ0_9FLAO|nr:VCBS repeat protein [Allomuricauda pacifica]
MGILFSGCKQKQEKEKLFKKRSASETGVSFKNQLTDTPELNILTYLYFYNGAGVAAGDFNNDGLPDLYFTSNQESDRLYLNNGNLNFTDITEASGIDNSDEWTTGVTQVDINNDGWLDIYVCKVGNYQTLKGKNLLYVNQGADNKGIPTFKEEADKYNLDFSGFSTQAAFFDYDLDGDLDMYLLNHSVKPNRTYGKGSKRKQIDSLSGDILFRNDDGKFMDVSQEAGIFQGSIGYGLGIGISDVNNDGYPDVYIGNDFFENDYFYFNQGNGTFKETISSNEKVLGHTSHFSMGNTIADINNDGWTDIISLDMLPENLETYKTSGLEYAFPTYDQYLRNGFAPQYMQNTLHLNRKGQTFNEIAHMSGVAATEWSWGALFADFDNDGHKDLFVSNGIKGATNDMDFISFIANEKIQKAIESGMTQKEMSFIGELPEKKVPNYFFKNNGDLTFSDVTNTWSESEDSFSHGCAYVDLDNDGDLDVVVNNVNEEAYILENTQKDNNRSLSLSFEGTTKNRFGVGVKVKAYIKGSTLVGESFPTKGYLSSTTNTIHLGLGKDSILDSLQVIWPSKRFQTLKEVSVGKLTLKYEDALDSIASLKHKSFNFFKPVEGLIPFAHDEKPTVEFNVDPLIPFANTNNGPSVSVADINQDGLDDVFISGAKAQASALFVQNKEGGFTQLQDELFAQDAFNEDVAHTFFDANGDGFKDLVVVSAGNEFKSSSRIQPRLYLNKNGRFVKDSLAFKGVELNASKVLAVDFDNDGDMDLTITSDQKPRQFGIEDRQYLFQNDGSGNFEDVTSVFSKEFEQVGNVKDASWIDLDGNGYTDLIVVGHWMPVTIFLNNGKELTLASGDNLENSHGLWNSLIVDDFDGDGDMDLVVGNWGLNSKLKASLERPLTLYSKDFDTNGSVEPLVTYYHGTKETPFASKDELVKQLPFLNKDFLSYKSFAKASLEDLFGEQNLDSAIKKEVYELASCYFENTGNLQFIKKQLPNIAQISTVNDMLADDFDRDGVKDLLLVGNNYEISTQLGRMDASHGIILSFKDNGPKWNKNIPIDISGPARSIEKATINNKEHYIIGINNSKPLFLERIINE